MDNLDIIASALDAAWEQLRCVCRSRMTYKREWRHLSNPVRCDCAVEQVRHALDLLRAEAEKNLKCEGGDAREE